MGYYNDDGTFVNDKEMKFADEHGYILCAQCGEGHIKDFEFDDTGCPIELSNCPVCGYPEK